MVKRFRIPPPPDMSRPSAKQIDIDLNSGDLEEAGRSLRDGGLLPLCEKLWKQWLPFVDKTVRSSPELPVAESDVDCDAHCRREDLVDRLCPVLAFLYLGRRLGNFHATLVTHSDGTGEEYERDGSKEAMSYVLTELAEVAGEHRAEQVFRRLERDTDALLERTFGRRR
jgi:hypothetical protein